MTIEVFHDAETVSRVASGFIAAQIRRAVSERGRFLMGVSGGRTPAAMFQSLAEEDLPWDKVTIAQVDERFAPEGHPDRNLTQLRADLLDRLRLPAKETLLLPVDDRDLEAAIGRFQKRLQECGGSPVQFDLIHLGLGLDGHTASLVPDDPVLGITSSDIGVTQAYHGRRRLTLTYPVLNRARRILWLITGRDKAPMLSRLRLGDPVIPAARVRADRSVVFADTEAAEPALADNEMTGRVVQ